MRLRLVDDKKLEETFFLPSKLDGHYEKHVAKDWETFLDDESGELLDPMTKEEYDSYGDELSKQPVKTSKLSSGDRYVGFVEKTGEIVKYDTHSHILIVYAARPNFQATFSLYKSTDDNDRYKRLLRKTYEREITPEDDYYNR